MIVDNTPVEVYPVGDCGVFVKREDLCCPYPGPSFSKMRGVYAHVKARPESVIGVLDTFHSKAGWAVSYAARALGKNVVNYWPMYKGLGLVIQPQQETARVLGADLRHLPAGRSAILYHRAKHDLAETAPASYMMPNALKLPESVTENAAEARRTLEHVSEGTVVISISSGTVAAGVIKGLGSGFDYVLHMGYSRSIPATLDYINGWLDFETNIQFIDDGYGYADRAKGDAPFPCNPYYDLKAWRWLNQPGIIDRLKKPVLFWNIGA